MIEVVAFAGTFTDTGEYRQAAVLLGDVVDQLQHVDGLADAGAAEQADFSTFRERHQQIDDFDARGQQILAASLFVERGRRAVNRQILGGLHRASIVLGRAQNVHDASEGTFSHRHLNGCTRGKDGQTATQTLGGAHRNRTDDTVAQLLLHFESEIHVFELQSFINVRNRLAWKLHVDDGADDLRNLAFGHSSHSHFSSKS